MVYKVVGNFNSDNFEGFLEKLGQNFKFIYYNGSLYLALLRYSDRMEAVKIIKKIVRPARDFLVREINELNLPNEDVQVIEWCRDNFVALERQAYEEQQQEKMKEAMKALDNMERILAQRKAEIENQKGG